MTDGSRAVRRVLPALLAMVVIGALTAAVVVPALSDRILDWSVAPQPPLVEGAVDGLVAVNNAVRAASPYTAIFAVIALITFGIQGTRSPRARMLNRLSTIEYAGIDHLGGPDLPAGRRGRLASRIRAYVQGTALATLAIVLVGATSGIESEITNGPLRPIDSLLGLVSDGDVTLVLQGPAVTFMDDSVIPDDAMMNFVASSPEQAVPFGKHLFNVAGKSAIEISIPDATYAAITGKPVPSACADQTIVVDDTVGVSKGQRADVNGQTFTVAAVRTDMAQMNRSVAILADSTVRNCIQAGTNSSYFGAVVNDSDPAAVREAIGRAGLSGMAAVSEADFKEENRDFWRANATPLLLQLIAYLALFSGFAAAGERQSALQRNSREIGMLNATGVDFGALRSVERRRALRTTLKAAVLAAPLMIPVAAAFNASELGVQIGVGPTELAVGTTLTLAAMLLASRRSLSQFRRTLDLPLAVKG